MYTYVCGITVYKCNKYQLWYAPFPNFHAKAFQKNRKSQVSIHKDFAIARAALIASTLLDVLWRSVDMENLLQAPRIDRWTR